MTGAGVQGQMQDAMRLHQEGRLADAEHIVRDVLQREPGNAQVHMVLGKMLRQQGRNDEAITSFEQAASIDAGLYEAQVHIGDLSFIAGDHAAAASAYSVALTGGANATLHNKLGSAQERVGDLIGAESSFRAALALDSAHAPALGNLGSVLMQQKRFDEARGCLDAALVAKPDHLHALVNLGLLDKQAGRLQASLDCFDRALRMQPDDTALMTWRGAVLQALGRLDEAEECFQTVLARDAGHADALACYSELMEWRGDYQAAAQLLDEHRDRLTRNPTEYPTLALAFARVQKSLGNIDDALAVLEPLCRPDGIRHHWYAQLMFTFGQLLDAAGQYDRALEVVTHANAVNAGHYNPQGFEAIVSSLIEDFSGTRFENLARGTGESHAPVFIVGMPRSGTSLVEQILAAHPQVFAAGERSTIGEIAMDIGFTTNRYLSELDGLDAHRFDLLQRRYLDALPEKGANARRFTDKMPLNYLHLGLIALIFPGARVIHCKRHPLDACVSCFFQDFADPALAFSVRQDWLAHYWQQYDRLMQHWQAVSPLELFDLRYECLVKDTEAQSRDLIAFLQLEWDPACLEFYKKRRVVHTASHAQIDRPVYDTAVGRATRFGAGLDVLRNALSGEVDAYESARDNAGR